MRCRHRYSKRLPRQFQIFGEYMNRKKSPAKRSSVSGKTEELNVEDLELDPENPRLPDSLKRTQAAMLEYIARSTDIEELMEVIGENGFFHGEALIVYPSPAKKGIYRVIEGNRRLSAVLLLRDPNQIRTGKRAKEISARARHRPERLPVVVYKTRDEVLTYLGYRHITGVKEWEPLAKARYIDQLYKKQGKRLSVDVRAKTVAREIGTKPTFIKRALKALVAYTRAESNEFYDIPGLEERSFDFSVLSTALGYESISNFIKLSEQDLGSRVTLSENRLKELMEWLFKKEGGRTVLGESRNLQKLARILESPAATKTLRSSKNIDLAYQETKGAEEDLERLVFTAKGALQQANALAPQVDASESVIKAAEDVMKQAKALYKILSSVSND